MGSIFAEMGGVFSALASNDAWEMKTAFATDGAWLAGLLIMMAGAVLALVLYRAVPFFERHLEQTVMVWTYLAIGAIIFVEVFRRFVFNEQAPWSTTLPPFLFLIMTWFGCTYNVRLRTHLSFAEFRMAMPPFAQLLCLLLDAALWIVFSWVVFVTSSRVVANSAANFQIMLGTDDVLQWWFLTVMPIAFTLLVARVIENVIEDLANYRAGRAMIEQAVIGGD